MTTVTVPDEHELLLIAKRIRKINPESHIIIKVHSMRMIDKIPDQTLNNHFIWSEKLGSEEIIKHLMEKKELIYK